MHATAEVTLSDTEIEALEIILAHFKKVGMGQVEFDVKSIDPIRRKLRTAAASLRVPADLEGQLGLDLG